MTTTSPAAAAAATQAAQLAAWLHTNTATLPDDPYHDHAATLRTVARRLNEIAHAPYEPLTVANAITWAAAATRDVVLLADAHHAADATSRRHLHRRICNHAAHAAADLAAINKSLLPDVFGQNRPPAG